MSNLMIFALQVARILVGWISQKISDWFIYSMPFNAKMTHYMEIVSKANKSFHQIYWNYVDCRNVLLVMC